MRNHLISVGIGFLLGGLVLVPLTLQLKSAAQPAAERAAKSPPADVRGRGQLRMDETRRLASGLFDEYPNRPERPDSRMLPAAGGTILTAREALATRGFVERGPATPAWREVFSSALLDLPRLNAARGAVHWATPLASAGDQRAASGLLPTAFELREDLRLHFGLVGGGTVVTGPEPGADMLLALLPRSTRFGETPAALVPGTGAVVPILQPVPAPGAGDAPASPPAAPVAESPSSASGEVVPTPQAVAALPPYGPRVPTATPSVATDGEGASTRPAVPAIVASAGGAAQGGSPIPIPASLLETPQDGLTSGGDDGLSFAPDDGKPVTGTAPGASAVAGVGNLVVAPEPGTLGLIALGVTAVCRRSRRQARSIARG